MPWQRVINAQGRISFKGQTERAELQRRLLEGRASSLIRFQVGLTLSVCVGALKRAYLISVLPTESLQRREKQQQRCDVDVMDTRGTALYAAAGR